MKKMIALVLALALALCCVITLAEDVLPMKTGVYTIINKTGEQITEVRITDNATGECNVFPGEGS
jgi:hypothetical protein